jgi:hypothetical protein
MKGIYMETGDLWSTFLWSLIGLGLLYLGIDKLDNKKVIQVSHLVLFITMLKALIYDSSQINYLGNELVFSPGQLATSSVLIVFITGIFYLASRKMSVNP